MQNWISITRRTSFRLALIVTAIVSFTNLFIFVMMFIISSNQLDLHLKAHVLEVRDTMVDTEDDEPDGFQELAAMVRRHSVSSQSDENMYLLTDSAGAYVAGNISSLARFDGWRTIPWQSLSLIGKWNAQRATTAVVGTWKPVKGGYLFVGAGNGNIGDARELLIRGLLFGIVFSILASVVSGFFLGRAAQRRVKQMDTVLDAVASGQLHQRIPRTSPSDDIDRVAELINATLDRLQRLIGNLKQGATDIAHDLRTPMNRVRQKLELAHADSPEDSSSKMLVEEAVADIDGIVATFDALLRISEVEAGARKAKFVEVELNELIENVVDALEAVADESGHRMMSALNRSIPVTVLGDRRLLNQLCVNLIENSIVHCPSGTEIEIEVSDGNEGATISVRDNGPGISEDEREKVFRRLYRVEKSRTSRGNGLGLSLVAAICELHDASIELSDNNPGLAVSVAFPARSIQ